jgi:hypothetical protein
MSTPARTSSPRTKVVAIVLAVVAAFLAAVGWFVLNRNLLNL